MLRPAGCRGWFSRLGSVPFWRAPVPRAAAALCVLFAVVVPCLLYESRIASYSLGWDDFRFVNDSLTWERTRDSLWKPFSNHLFPPFRVLTWALVVHAGRLSALPSSLALGSLVALVVALLVLYEFVSRETGSTARGIVAMLVAGMTSVYYPSVAVYSTSQIVWGVAFTLLVLVCLQSARDRFRWPAAIGAGLAALLAPAWISTGLVAGPLGSAYAWLSGGNGRWSSGQRVVLAAAPLIGTCAFLLLAFGLAGRELIDAPESGVAPPLEAARPFRGAYLAARIGTEHLLFWSVGLPVHLAAEQFAVCFVALGAFIAIWLCRAAHRTQAICALGLMLASYLLIYSFRHHLGLERLRVAHWYLVYPHFAWSLFLSAGLIKSNSPGERPLTVLHAVRLATLGLALFLLHQPVAERQAQLLYNPRQANQLKQLDLIQVVCTRWGIDHDTLAEAIGPFVVNGSGGFDGLQLIECPAASRSWDREELRRRFAAVFASGSADSF